MQVDYVKDLETADDPGLSSGPSVITSGLIRGRQEGQCHRRRRGDRRRDQSDKTRNSEL